MQFAKTSTSRDPMHTIRIVLAWVTSQFVEIGSLRVLSNVIVVMPYPVKKKATVATLPKHQMNVD